MSGTESEMIPEPDWLAAEPTARAKVSAIMAAVRRCQAECGEDGLESAERTGPHLSTTMAEVLIGQLLFRAAADERESIRQLAIDLSATCDETRPCSCGQRQPDGSPYKMLIRTGVPFADLLRETP